MSGEDGGAASLRDARAALLPADHQLDHPECDQHADPVHLSRAGILGGPASNAPRCFLPRICWGSHSGRHNGAAARREGHAHCEHDRQCTDLRPPTPGGTREGATPGTSVCCIAGGVGRDAGPTDSGPADDAEGLDTTRSRAGARSALAGPWRDAHWRGLPAAAAARRHALRLEGFLWRLRHLLRPGCDRVAPPRARQAAINGQRASATGRRLEHLPRATSGGNDHCSDR